MTTTRKLPKGWTTRGANRWERKFGPLTVSVRLLICDADWNLSRFEVSVYGFDDLGFSLPAAETGVQWWDGAEIPAMRIAAKRVKEMIRGWAR